MVQLGKLEAFHRADPNNPVLACELADALLAAGRIDQAREMLSALAPQVRADLRIRFREARCALLGGQMREAAEQLQSLEDTAADGPVLRHDLAFVQMATGEIDAGM
jgi:thioredoxin-like negative regulator of GroEL